MNTDSEKEPTHPIDLTRVLNQSHSGKWVAFNSEARSKVVASADTLEEAYKRALDNGCSDPIMHKVSPFDVGIAF